MAAAHLRNGALALVVLGAAALYVTTENEVVSYLAYYGAAVGAGVAACLGAARAPRRKRLVPVLIAAGISLSSVGEVLWAVADARGDATDVSLADPFWFTSYVALCAALWVIIKSAPASGADHRRADLNLTLDVVTVVVVSVLVFWSLTINTIVADDSVAPAVRAVWVAYPVADAVLLALVLRVVLSRRSRAGIDAWFVAGVGLWLVADIAYLLAPDHAGAALDVGWVVAPVLMARAAWHRGQPSLGESPEPGPRRRGGQLALAVGPLLVPPGLELVTDLQGQQDQPLQLLTGTAALVALALVRTARLLRSEDLALRDLEAARDAALEASRAKTLFVANVSHEIRTPLTTVLASGEMLEDTSLDEEQRHLLSKLNRSGELLKSLVEALLDFSRMQAGELRLASTAFDLRAMVADLDEVYRSRATATGIVCGCRLAPGVPHTVVGDPGRLFQILTNLLDNALKFTHDGEVHLLVRSTPRQVGGPAADGLEFVISDTGIGIREEDQERIFASFHQVDGSTTRSYGGNGLGLAICHELAQLMGGCITVQSQLGAGSTFVVRLPLLPAGKHHELGTDGNPLEEPLTGASPRDQAGIAIATVSGCAPEELTSIARTRPEIPRM